jgi:tetratricopeptide (TPR) repeat protein
MQVSQQNITGATRTFEQALRKFPDESNVYTYYGEVLMAIQSFDEAEKMFDKAIKLDAKNATPLMHKGWLLLQAKSDVVSAVTLLDQAIKVDPTSDQVYNRLAAILIQQGLFDKAIQCYDKAIENNHNIQDLANTISCREAAIAQKQVMIDNPSIIPEGVVVPQE